MILGQGKRHLSQAPLFRGPRYGGGGDAEVEGDNHEELIDPLLEMEA
jgi:hypothetical protein